MFTRGLAVGLFLMFGVSFRLISGENVVNKENDVLALVKKAAGYMDPDPNHFAVLTKIYAADPRLILDILPLLDIRNPSFYNANLVGMIQVLERKNVQPTALPKIRELLDTTSNDISKRDLHYVIFGYLSKFGDSSDCARLKSFGSSENIVVRTIALQELKKLETRLAAMKTNTPPSSISTQNITNVTVNPTAPENQDRSPNSIPSTTVEKTDGPSAGFMWARIVTFMVAAVSGFLFVFFRRWRKH